MTFVVDQTLDLVAQVALRRRDELGETRQSRNGDFALDSPA
jgi:hypothetical protein